MDTQYVKNIAATACEFLKKAKLDGIEVQKYSEVWNFLNAIIGGELTAIEVGELDSLRSLEKESQDFVNDAEELAAYRAIARRWKAVRERMDQHLAERLADKAQEAIDSLPDESPDQVG